MKYLALLPLLLLACGGVDSVDGFQNGGTSGGVSLGGSVSGGAGGVSPCDPDQHCHGGSGGTGGVVVVTGGTNTGGTNTGGSVTGGTVSTGGVTQTGGAVSTGGTVSTGGVVNKGGSSGQGGASGSGGDDSAGAGGCNNTCDDDYTVCKTKCYNKQCSHSVRWECLCACKKVHEECEATSCNSDTHTCSH